MLTVNTSLPSLLQPSMQSYSFRTLRYFSKASTLDNKVAAFAVRLFAVFPVTFCAALDLIDWCGQSLKLFGNILRGNPTTDTFLVQHMADLVSTVTIPITTLLMSLGGTLPSSNRLSKGCPDLLSWDLYHLVLNIRSYPQIIPELLSRLPSDTLNHKFAFIGKGVRVTESSLLNHMLIERNISAVNALLQAGAEIDNKFLQEFCDRLDLIVNNPTDFQTFQNAWRHEHEQDGHSTVGGWLTYHDEYWNPETNVQTVESARKAIAAVHKFQRSRAVMLYNQIR